MIFNRYPVRELLIYSVILILIVLTSKHLYVRYDLSSEGLFSLSEESKKIARSLPKKLSIDLYYSQNHPSQSPPYKAFCARVVELLKEFEEAGSGKISLNIIDPIPDSDQELMARKQGITPIPTPSKDYIYFGAVFHTETDRIVTPYIDPNREEFIEYELAETIIESMKPDKKTIYLFTSLDIFGGSDQNHEEWVAIKRLKKSVNIQQTDLRSTIPKTAAALVILHPQYLNTMQEYHIDQYLLRGGKIFIAIDPFSRAKHSRNRRKLLDGHQEDSSSSLPRLLPNWGITFDPTLLVGDSLRAKKIESFGKSFQYPFFISLSKKELNAHHPITRNLNEVLLAEPGSIAFENENKNLQLTPLMLTSEKSGVHTTDMALFLSPGDLTARFKSDDKKRILAAIISGDFKSAFKAPPSEVSQDNHLSSSQSEGFVTVIADIDFMDDPYSIEKISFYNRTILKPKNDNQALFINTVEFLTGNQNLLAIRRGGSIRKPFLLFDSLKSEAELKYRSMEAKINGEIKSLQHQISSMSENKSDLMSLTANQEQKLQSLREQEAQLRLQQRRIRYQLHKEIDNLKQVLIFMNLVLPILLIVLLYFWFQRRRLKAGLSR